MDKEQILRQIRRTAEQNGGIPLGQRRFTAETEIRESKWRGIYWARWGDALREAGFAPNLPHPAYGDEFLIENVIALIRRLGRLPTWAERVMEGRQNAAFPSEGAFRRAGMSTMGDLASRVTDFCEARDGFDDVLRLSQPVARRATHPAADDGLRPGTVYLYKSGRHYKIGRAFNFGRRSRQIKLQLPEPAVLVHSIGTDDVVGVEAYWHKRFEAKRKNGEWFELDETDVRAFKRRKSFM